MDGEFQAELAAIAEIGQRRSRVRTVAFVAAWCGWFAVFFALRYAGIRMGFFYIAVLASGGAGGIAVAVAKKLSPKIISQVAEKHGLPEKQLEAGNYLIE